MKKPDVSNGCRRGKEITIYWDGTGLSTEANRKDDARVYEHAAHETATATSSRSVLGNVPVATSKLGAERGDYAEADSDYDAVQVNKTDDKNNCIIADGV